MLRKKVFISYSHKDEKWRSRVVDQLAVIERTGLLDVWDDQKLAAGEEWLSRLHEEMASARVAVLLLSASFLSSPFILEHEVPKLFRRHERDGMRIYPLLIRPCAWRDVPWVARMQLRPSDAKAISTLRGARAEQILADASSEIAAVIREDLPRATSSDGGGAPPPCPSSATPVQVTVKPPTIFAEFELEDGAPVQVKSSYKLWIGVKNVPEGTERVVYGLHDERFKEPRRTVDWGPKDFMTPITSWGDIPISARGRGSTGDWRAQTSLKAALRQRYGRTQRYIIQASIREIEDN